MEYKAKDVLTDEEIKKLINNYKAEELKKWGKVWKVPAFIRRKND